MSKPTAGRREARLQSFVKLRDEAQFLGTLYTGMDLAANLQAARTAVPEALGGLRCRRRADRRGPHSTPT